ncbi:MAG: proteasome assembly chaperone (PAC2) family protein [Candidatus Poriferisodalaceae bacterium]
MSRVKNVEWFDRPDLSDAVMIAAFSGWNDAADAATEAVRYLARRWDAQTVACIDAEPFYDFASARPTIRLIDGERRQLEWPRNEFMVAELDDGRPLVLLLGIEPRLMWRTFSEAVNAAAEALGVTTIVSLGALLTETHHDRPVEVVGASNNQELNDRLGLRPSTYEGPTGITGVINDAAHRAGFNSLSFWAAVPSYLGQSPSPKAALALVQRVADFLDITLGATDLQIAASSYERQIVELMEDDPNLAAYADQLAEEDALLEEEPELENDPEALIDELEQFLRQQED